MTTMRNPTTPLADGTEQIHGDRVLVTFPGVAAFARQAARGGSFHSHDNSVSTSWDLAAGFDGAVRLARGGWREGLAMARALLANVDAAFVAADLPHHALNVVGSRVCVPSYLSGTPRCYHRENHAERPRDAVRLLVSVTASAYYDAALAMHRGAALAACVDALESRGVPVEVVAGMDGRAWGGGVSFSLRVVVKHAADPLDLDALVYAAAHAAFFRRLGFAVLEQYHGSAWTDMLVHGAYGIPCDAADADPLVTCVPLAQNRGDWSTPAAALASMTRMIPALTGYLEDAA